MYIEDIRQRIAELDRELKETRESRLAFRHQLETSDGIQFLSVKDSMEIILGPGDFGERWMLSEKDVMRCFDCDSPPERVIVCNEVPFFHCEKHFDERLQAKADRDADIVLGEYNMI